MIVIVWEYIWFNITFVFVTWLFYDVIIWCVIDLLVAQLVTLTVVRHPDTLIKGPLCPRNTFMFCYSESSLFLVSCYRLKKNNKKNLIDHILHVSLFGN